MKKTLFKMLAGMMAILMIFAMAACNAPAETPEENVVEPVETEAEIAVKEYVEAANLLVNEAYGEDQSFEIKLEARGTAIVYVFTSKEFDNLSDEDLALMKSVLDGEIEKQKDTFATNLKEVQSEEPNVSAIVLEYYDKSGKLITSAEF